MEQLGSLTPDQRERGRLLQHAGHMEVISQRILSSGGRVGAVHTTVLSVARSILQVSRGADVFTEHLRCAGFVAGLPGNTVLLPDCSQLSARMGWEGLEWGDIREGFLMFTVPTLHLPREAELTRERGQHEKCAF